jgi:hypothetical protein
MMLGVPTSIGQPCEERNVSGAEGAVIIAAAGVRIEQSDRDLRRGGAEVPSERSLREVQISPCLVDVFLPRRV